VPRIVRSRLADDDLDEIWAYVDADNPAAAEKLMRSLTDKFELLANHEGLGTTRRHIDERIRVFPVGRYLILFRRIDDGIEVVRVVHSARDLRKLKLQ
jgi:toxin ParE1/3/4